MNNYELRRCNIAVLTKLGLPLDDVSVWSDKLQKLRGNAKAKGVVCRLSFEQYVTLALEANISDPRQIGKANDNYQMSRIGDIGDYIIGNCRFLTGLQNKGELKINGGGEVISKVHSARTIAGGDLGRIRQSEKLSKCFKLTSPEGDVFVGKNVRKFAKERGLDPSNLTGVLHSNYARKYRGWSGKYISEDEYSAHV